METILDNVHQMRRLLTWLILLAVLLTTLTGASAFLSWKKDRSLRWVEHTYHALYVQSDLLSACQDLNLASRGYLLSRDPYFLQLYQQSLSAAQKLFSEVAALTADRPSQQERLMQFKNKLSILIQRSDDVRDLAQEHQTPADVKALVAAQRDAMIDLRKVLDGVVKEEQTLLQERKSIAQQQENIFWALLAVLVCAGVVLVFLMLKALDDYKKETEASIDELGKARDVARAAQRTAESALEAKTRFLATISHEVRTPMAGVIGIVEMLYVTGQGEIKELAKTALDACMRLLQILNDLLDASKLQAGALKLEHRIFAVRPIIGDLVQLVQLEADKKQIRIISQVATDVPELICGDELRIRQILQNLVFNAIKFTEKGTISLLVEVTDKRPATTVLKFSVTDTGIGITDEQQKKIFEPFEQAESSTTRIYGGTGLGLSICKTLVELMSGEIGVSSKEGQGSTFWILIPVHEELCNK